MHAVILAGGAGTRLGELCRRIPKPMVEICGKPVLQHQIEVLKKEGIRNFILICGHLGEAIEKFFGNGQSFGVDISYYRETEPMGTGGMLSQLEFDDDFLLCNGDLIFDFSVKKMLAFHKEKHALITVFSHPNSHPYDSDLFETDKDFCIKKMIAKGTGDNSCGNLCGAGIYVVSPRAINKFNEHRKLDFDKDIMKPLIGTGRVFAYKSAEYVKDMGTPERMAQAENEVAQGIVAAKNSLKAQCAIFLDRDGTINKHNGYICKVEDVELLPGVAQAISVFRSLGYLVIVVTNQPQVARGECSDTQLKKIHNRLEGLLGKESAYVDAIYYCPHHPDKGFEGEVAELKFDCSCRKPKPGMILQAQKDFNIELGKSFMVGDSFCDVQAAKNSGCIPIYIGTENVPENVAAFSSLYEFAAVLKAERDKPQ